MKSQLVAKMGLLVVVIGLMSLALMFLTTRSDTNISAQEYQKLTGWGDPDLQGMWSYASLTPLQRPLRLGEKEFYSTEEASNIYAGTQGEQAVRAGDVGSYNSVYYDRGKISPNLRTSLIINPRNGRLPLKQETIQKQAQSLAYRREHPADSWLDRSNWDRCITYHGVPPISTGYNNTYQIVQDPNYVAIVVENIHDVRIIPLDGRPRLNENIRQWNGDSRGHWEGNTLVVETTNYSDKTRLRFPSSKNMIAVERFTRVSDDLIDYEFTVEDPEVYTSSWTAVRPLPALQDYDIYEYACHEGNYAMWNILRGQRLAEKQATQAGGK